MMILGMSTHAVDKKKGVDFCAGGSGKTKLFFLLV